MSLKPPPDGHFYKRCECADCAQERHAHWMNPHTAPPKEKHPPTLVKCDHPDFHANVTVNRLQDTGRFQADVTICCAQCHLPFRFIGLPAGLDLNGASTSADATEARLAIAPKGEVVSAIQGGQPTGFSVRRQG